MKLKLGKWEAKREAFMLRGDIPAVAGISGGRTSAMMAAMLDPRVVLTFQNTGREHPKTYEFLVRLQDGLQREIIWLEYRPPTVVGAPPREARFAVVNEQTAACDGAPFVAMLDSLAAYRQTKSEGPIAPWARSRICTAYLKHRTQTNFIKATYGWETFDEFVGLRADEPERVHRLTARDTETLVHRCPLYTAGITKQDVNEFWYAQPFDLKIAPHQGNCTGCFLKDQSDLARVLNEPETDAAWWATMQRRFPQFGGHNFPRYLDLLGELPTREAIQEALAADRTPTNDFGMPAARFKNVVRQEARRRRGELEAFACMCEQSEAIAEDGE